MHLPCRKMGTDLSENNSMKFLFIICCIVVTSCSQRMMQTDLYFGQSKPDGSMITENEWKQFRENYISRVFKEGSTEIKVSGNWMDTATHQLISEPTYLVRYFYKRSPSLSNQIDSLCYWYKKQYMQQSVLRVDRKVKASF